MVFTKRLKKPKMAEGSDEVVQKTHMCVCAFRSFCFAELDLT